MPVTGSEHKKVRVQAASDHPEGPPLTQQRCAWAQSDPLMQAYHDAEWGRPERDGRALWEKLMLDGFQAGLSWITILRKRDAFREAFAGFDPVKVARFTEADVTRLLGNAGIIRSHAKIEATIGGARAYLAMRAAGEDFPTSAGAWSAASRSKTRPASCRRRPGCRSRSRRRSSSAGSSLSDR